jgi:D-alanyl-D-alanine carboxypeptidase (penicillin-binding protein 5/6)
MRSFLPVIFLILLLTPCGRVCTAGELSLTADAAVLIDYQTGAVLYSYNATEPLPPASTTKILAAILSLEMGEMKEPVVIDYYSASIEGTSLYLKTGQKFSLYDITKGALINSGNDAAAAIAVHMAGSEEQFAALMNYKAKTIGCWQNCFCNPHGLPQDGHTTSAYDLARITRYALHNKDFRQIVGTKSDRIRELSGKGVIDLYNTNRLLGHQNGDLKVIGVKTGTTSEAGECLVAAAKYKNHLLISVVLGSGDRYADTLRLFEYGASDCHHTAVKGKTPLSQVPVKRGTCKAVAVGTERDVSLMISTRQLPLLDKRIYLKPNIKAPCRKGEAVGRIEIRLENNLICTADLVTLQDVPGRSFWWNK